MNVPRSAAGSVTMTMTCGTKRWKIRLSKYFPRLQHSLMTLWSIRIPKMSSNFLSPPFVQCRPASLRTLPFPTLEGKSLATFWKAWSTIKDQVRRRRAIYIYGSMGYGKSHILAALACLLIRTGHRIVYLPDCRAMLGEPLSYVQRALRLALWKPEDTNALKKVLECKSFEELITICEPIENLCFMIDQENALDSEPSTADNVSNEDKAELQKCLRRICFMKISITSASANHKSARYMRQKQTDDVKIALLGGLSNVWSLDLNCENYLR